MTVHKRLLSADIVEEVGVEVIVERRSRGGSKRRLASHCRDWRRHRDQPSHLAQVLSGSGEMELVAGAAGPA
jgi:hypothetical protein